MKKKIIAPWLFVGIMVFATACGSTKDAVAVTDTAGVGKALDIEVEDVATDNTIEGTSKKLVPKVHETKEFDKYTEAATESVNDVIDTDTELDPEFLIDSYNLDWYALESMADYTIVIDGDTYTLPMSASELFANGWELCDGYEDEVLASEDFYNCDVQRGDKVLNIGIENFYSTEQNALDCDVWKLNAVWGNWLTEDEVYAFELPKYNIALGEAAPKNIDNPAYFGEGMEFEATDYANHWWETIGGDDVNSHVEVGRFMVAVDEDGIVSGITISCSAKGSDFTGEKE